MKRSYQDQLLDKQLERVSTINKKLLLTSKPNNSSTNRIPLVLTFNKTKIKEKSTKIKEIVDKHWNLLQINSNHKNMVDEKPIVTNRKNRNFRELIRSNRVLNDRVVYKNNMAKN